MKFSGKRGGFWKLRAKRRSIEKMHAAGRLVLGLVTCPLKRLMSVLFAGLWMAVVALMIAGYADGEMDRLVRGMDMYGHLCGSGELEDKGIVYFLLPEKEEKTGICVSGCPLETMPEYLSLYSPDLTTSPSDIKYDTYPSRPYYTFCLPAHSHLRKSLSSQLFSRQQDFTFSLRDIIEGKFILILSTSIISLLVFLLFLFIHTASYMKVAYVAWHFLLYLELGVLSYGLYIEPIRQKREICSDYDIVKMQDCEVTFEGYETLFEVCVALFWGLLVVAAWLVQFKKDAFTLVSKMNMVSLKASFYIILAYMLGIALLFVLLSALLHIDSIGSMSDLIFSTETPYPGFHWEYDMSLRLASTALIVVVGLWTLSLLSQWVMLMTAKSVERIRRIDTKKTKLIAELIYASVTFPANRWCCYHLPLFQVNLRSPFAFTPSLHSEDAVDPPREDAQVQPESPLRHRKNPENVPMVEGPNRLIQAKLLLPRDAKVADFQWNQAQTLESFLWTLELTLTLLGPAVVLTLLLTCEESLICGKISSYLVLEVTILPLSYFVSQLLGNYIRGWLYPKIVKEEPKPDFPVGIELRSEGNLH